MAVETVYDAEGDEISFLWEEDPNMVTPWIMLQIFNPTAGHIMDHSDLPSTLDGQCSMSMSL